ncbi:MAG: phage major capsid protein, partial [Pseudomonadota bacterium]
FGKSERASEMLARVRDGEIAAVSVGYRIHEMILAGERDDRRIYRATRWEPTEISLVAVPADPSVGVGRDDDGGTDCITIRTESEVTKPNTAAKPDSSAEGVETADRAAPAVPAQAKGPTAVEVRHAEIQRGREINALARKFGVDEEATAKAIAEGETVDSFRAAIMDKMESREAEADRVQSAVIGMSEAETRRFSFTNAIRGLDAMARGDIKAADKIAGFEFEASAAAAAAMKREARGLIVPVDVLAHGSAVDVAAARNAQRTLGLVGAGPGQGVTGGALVDDVLLAGSFIDILRNKAVLPRLGVRVLGGLVGDVSIPKQTGSTNVEWIGEDQESTESGIQTGQVPMTPHTASAHSDISRKLLMQSSLDVEALVRMDIAAQIALAIDLAGLNGDADPHAPNGLADQPGINTVTFATAGQPTFKEVVEMWEATAVANADEGTMGYALAPAQVTHLRTTTKFAGGDVPIMVTRGELDGYRAAVSNQVTAGQMWFGNWADFIMGLWSGLDLTVDPYSLSKSGATRLVAFQDVDFAVRHAKSFTRGAAA